MNEHTHSSRFAGHLTAVFGSLLFTAVLLLAAEACVRMFTEVGRLGTERELFANDAFGASIGNRPRVSAVAFGVEVHIDGDGFRSTGSESRPAPRRRILVLGDSVAFGVGIEFEQVAASLVDARYPDIGIVNTSVIGYGVTDYANVAGHVLQHSDADFAGVAVLLCLNDAWITSAARIGEAVAVARPLNVYMATASPTIGADAITRLKANSFVRSANELFRAHSSLYVLARGFLTDPQTRYWQHLLGEYEALSQDELDTILAPLVRVKALAESRHIPLRVIVQPYAGQMQESSSALPQRMIRSFLDRASIEHRDLLSSFRGAERPPALFLPYDPMHLAAQGHAIVADALDDFVRAL